MTFTTLLSGESKDDGSGSQQGQANSTNANLANTREKTPMCLVNELARFNKIQHQYRLTNEQGPAHKKRFTVTLMLGEEEYVAEGPSIKKAQHSAASDALTKTWYRKPPPKPTRAMRIPGKCPAGSGKRCFCSFQFSMIETFLDTGFFFRRTLAPNGGAKCSGDEERRANGLYI